MNVSLEEYFKTTFEDKLIVKMPERENDHLTPATRLLERRRELNEAEQTLSAQKEEFQMKMESLQQRREELERKEFQLKESLVKFDKFLKENDAKKVRALKKATEERDMRRQKEVEIEKLKAQLNLYMKIKAKLQKKLDQYIPYQKYLEKVVENMDEFNEIREVLDRHDALTGTSMDLTTRDQGNQDTLENQKQQLTKVKEEKTAEILSCNNLLSQLHSKQDAAVSNTMRCENDWARIKNTATEKTLELGKIKMSTLNLYQLISRYQHQLGYVDIMDTNGQLASIQMCAQDFNQITNDIKKEIGLTNSPINVETM